VRLGYKVRLVGWHAVVLAAILGVSAVGVDWLVRRTVLDQFDAALLHAAQSVTAEIAEEGPMSPESVSPVKASRRLLWSFRPTVQVADARGAVLAPIGAPQPLPIDPATIGKALRGKVVFTTRRDGGGGSTRTISMRAMHQGAAYVVQIAHPLDELHVLLRRVRVVVIGTLVAVLAAIVSTDLFLTRRVLRPIDAIVRQARRLSETNLAERLPHPGEPGEVGRLVETLNDMLARLHDSLEAQRRFTADAAHELRSPLTRLQTEFEVFLRRPRDIEQSRALVTEALDEIRRLGTLTENLLALARLDSGEGSQQASHPTELSAVVHPLMARFGPLAKARGVRVEVDGDAADACVSVLPGVVEVVLANVVDNAVKFSRAGGVVRVGTTSAAHHAVITVSDTGAGIPADELPHVCERFFRGRAARTTGTAGVGLGLAIARTLVRRQRGDIDIRSGRSIGTVVRIQLPLFQDPGEGAP
jgi:two-component system OmpR family sensor kinase